MLWSKVWSEQVIESNNGNDIWEYNSSFIKEV